MCVGGKGGRGAINVQIYYVHTYKRQKYCALHPLASYTTVSSHRCIYKLLPSASQRNGEGNVFTDVCPSTPIGGTPIWPIRGLPPSQIRIGDTPSQVRMGGGHPLPRSGCGGTPSQVRMGGEGTPSQVRMGGGYPLARSGQEGTPFPGWDEGGVCHPRSGWRYPFPGQYGGYLGYPLSVAWGPRSGWGGTPNWNSMACTCLAAGGMPLAFTQEDFVVEQIISQSSTVRFR